MRFRSKILCAAAIASTIALSSCTKGVFVNPVYLSVGIAPRPSAIPAGATVVFAASVSNNLSLPQWSLLDSTFTSSAGVLTPISGATDSISYTAPLTPPIYSSGTATSITQGTVTLAVNVPPLPQSTLPAAHDSVSFFITAATISVGISPATAAVPFNATQQFVGYAVGSVNNALTWQVNGVAGGSAATGSISASGLFTAPGSQPITGNTVTITAISQADPSKSAFAAVTLH